VEFTSKDTVRINRGVRARATSGEKEKTFFHQRGIQILGKGKEKSEWKKITWITRSSPTKSCQRHREGGKLGHCHWKGKKNDENGRRGGSSRERADPARPGCSLLRGEKAICMHDFKRRKKSPKKSNEGSRMVLKNRGKSPPPQIDGKGGKASTS